jgi:hypothetical protein
VPKKTSAKQTPAKKVSAQKAAPLDQADPRFVPVIKALTRSPGFSVMESKSGAMRGLMRDGASFGMSSHGRFILKLTEARAAALIADGVGKPFSPSAGRVLKGWLEVTQPKANWVTLAKEAYSLTAGTGAKRRPRSASSSGAATSRGRSRATGKSESPRVTRAR